MGTSIFIPGLPMIGRELGMNSTQLSATLTLYALSFSAVMIIAGPLSDAWGRKKFVLAGLILFAISSIGCSLAESPTFFYIGRIIQGGSVGMIQVPVLAMVRDECPGPQAYTVLGLLGAITGIIPVVSMLIGGLVIEQFGWRPLFFILAGAAVASLTACFSMPETLASENRLTNIDMTGTLKIYRNILGSKQVLLVTSPLLLFALFQGGYLIIAPLALEIDFGLTPIQFALFNILIVGGMAAGQFSATKAVKHIDPKKLYVSGALIALFGGAAYTFLTIISAMNHAILFMIPLTLIGFSYGFMQPIGLKSLFDKFKETPAMASAMYASLLLIFQGGGSTLAGLLMHSTLPAPAVMAWIVAPLGVAITILTWTGKKRLL